MGLYEHEGLEHDEIVLRMKKINEDLIPLIADDELRTLAMATMNIYGNNFCESVGSASKHHNYPGGLLDHTVEVIELSRQMAKVYQDKVNMDLVTTGALLHDIGKIVAYETAPNLKSGKRPKKAFQRSAEDKVMGHFGEALLMLEFVINETGLEIGVSKIRALFHIIASHHGEARLNWGSMTDPVTNEAHIVALADLLSSRIK